ncbi:THUMP domain-containing protein 1-like isoform X3 [Cyprinus carpio]|uniref:THUMP domain-containing protein 1 n=1 Tax=Cyprinus carpio TaxID=7962 RepID=A0A9Q9VYC9_CYPCA|nr:THUMP domain-containing protein 1-like isoform X2 [Cyprinus carpio]XP_042573465.1 THUMP domain-containing protein 1-like isoform X3 [Cyprinus carpio]
MSETRKRSRRRFGGHAHKKQRGARELEVGAQGVLVTCNMNERKCTSEAFSLLSEYADALYGPEQPADTGDSLSEDEEDAEAALKKEVSQIQSSMKTRQQRFSAAQSGANNVVFIHTHGVDPEQLVHHILSDLHQTKKRKSRVILRMLPVSGTCRAFPEYMEKFLSVFLERWFRAPQRATYQICFKARNSSHNKREEVISAVAGLVGKLNPLNKVDLTNPELSIIIEIIKTVCCVSVLKDYMLFRKYNLQEVAKESTNQSTGPQEVAKEPTNQSTGPQEAANQSTGPQEAANQSTGPQEAANQSTGKQEAANQTQEHGEGEKAETESCNFTAGNGTKEAELE